MAEHVRGELDATDRSREEGLACCRTVIRACGRAIRAVHRHDPEEFTELAEQAQIALSRAHDALRSYPGVAFAGFLHDAEKEYAEARLTAALVGGDRLPEADELGVRLAAWLNGLAEAAQELRRHLLDRLRAGELVVAENLLVVMEDVYDLLMTIDYPDAITGGLRRSTDALRGVLERSRADVTMAILHDRLRQALDRAAT